VKGKPATQAERDALTFKPIPIPERFLGTNEEWALAHLPHVRMAAVMLAETPESLQDVIKEMAEDGHAPALLDGWCWAKQEMLDLAKLLDVAISRSLLMLERLGYDPEKNPPPDRGDVSTRGPSEGTS
jgi:hypothetical protein